MHCIFRSVFFPNLMPSFSWLPFLQLPCSHSLSTPQSHVRVCPPEHRGRSEPCFGQGRLPKFPLHRQRLPHNSALPPLRKTCLVTQFADNTQFHLQQLQTQAAVLEPWDKTVALRFAQTACYLSEHAMYLSQEACAGFLQTLTSPDVLHGGANVERFHAAFSILSSLLFRPSPPSNDFSCERGKIFFEWIQNLKRCNSWFVRKVRQVRSLWDCTNRWTLGRHSRP